MLLPHYFIYLTIFKVSMYENMLYCFEVLMQENIFYYVFLLAKITILTHF